MLPKQPKATLAFTALALLTLSACGGGENTASPASSSASSASVSASSSAVASPEASPSESTAYSGGSKAPAGEYRPADEHGPAQNVPKPKAPEGMNVETLEGGLFKSKEPPRTHQLDNGPTQQAILRINNHKYSQSHTRKDRCPTSVQQD